MPKAAALAEARESGAIRGVAGETWHGVDQALRWSYRGLPGGSSLGRLLLGNGDEGDAVLLEGLHHLGEVEQRATQAIDFIANHG
jgi:hypothetical protein